MTAVKMPTPEPALELVDLALAGPRGPIFGPVSLVLAPGQLGVVHGPSGSGRSALLLAAAARLAVGTGRGRLAGHDLRTHARQARKHAAVARIADLVDLEPQLTVGESLVERSLTEGVSAVRAERALAECEALWSCEFPRDALVADLDALDRARLTLALARVRLADLVVFDDVDHDLEPTDQQQLYAAMSASCASGAAVLATTTDPATIPPHAVVVSLAFEPSQDH
jgi:ABC-2 type transport system ATP-binding protein